MSPSRGMTNNLSSFCRFADESQFSSLFVLMQSGRMEIIMGGTFTGQNQLLPGVYINFMGNAVPAASIGSRGVAALVIPLSWGVTGQVITVTNDSNFLSTLGYNITDPELIHVKEALKNAQSVLIYRSESGAVAASTTIGNFTATATCGGVRGNDIAVSSTRDLASSNYTVKTLVGGIVVDSQVVKNSGALANNAWVNFSSTDSTLPSNNNMTLAGGSDGTVDCLSAINALKPYTWNTIGLCVDSATDKETLCDTVRDLRDNEGKYVQGVVCSYPVEDYEGIISVYNGVTLADGTVLTAADAVAYITGATAGATITDSLTYSSYIGAIATNPMLQSEIVSAISSGEIVFVQDVDRVRIEQDINTLKTFAQNRQESFHKNRVLRVLDGIGNDLQRLYGESYIGQISNDQNGQNLFKSGIVKYMQSLQSLEAIQNFSSDDVTVSQGDNSDSIVVTVAVQPVDSIEKIYTTINVQ